MKAMPNLTVLYDGGCPLCSAEIAHYRDIAAGRSIAFEDVAANPAFAGSCGLTPEAALARFHVRVGDQVLSGAAAFAALWKELPGAWRFLGTVASLPFLSGAFEILYWLFLRARPQIQRIFAARQRQTDGS
jgi:predicted DCC family thiol-disulfide oxidoreductase YuxK